MELHILLAGVEFGPYSEDKARQLLDEGFLSADDPAKRLDEADWLPLAEVLGVSGTPAAAPPGFTALAATLDEEPVEEFHAPLPAGSEVAELPMDEPAESGEIAEPEADAHEPEHAEIPPAAEAPSPKPDLSVSRPSPPVFRSTMPIPARPGTTSLPPPRIMAEAKSATQSLPKSKTRRVADSDIRRSITTSALKPATPEIKSSFAAALAKTRSVSAGDTAPLPAPPRSGALTTKTEEPAPAPARPDPAPQPSRPASLAPKLDAPEAPKKFVTSPLRVASVSATATSPLMPVTSAARAKKTTVTGSLAMKEALLKARDRTGVLGARMTSALAPAPDFEPEAPVARKRGPVVLAGRESSTAPVTEPTAARKAIKLTGPISLGRTSPQVESAPAARLAPPMPDEAVAEPVISEPKVSPTPAPIPVPEPEVAKSAPAPENPAPAPEPPKREDPLVKPSGRKAIKLTGPISLPGRATSPTPRSSSGMVDTAPLTGLLSRPNRRGVALPVAPKEQPKFNAPEPVAPPVSQAPSALKTPPPLPAPLTSEEPEEKTDPDLTASGSVMSSGSLKITGALKQSPPPRTPVRLSSPSGEIALTSTATDETTELPAKPVEPVPEEKLTHRAPTGKIPLHEFPTEGVRVRTTRRLTSKVPLPINASEAITSESPQRVPPPLPKKIETPEPPPPEPLPVAPAIMPGPADVIVERSDDTPKPKEVFPETAVAPMAEPLAESTETIAEPAPPPTLEPAAPVEIAKPEKARLRRPVKLELSSRKINDSGRLTLEAFSKMASQPTAPVEAAPAATPEAEADPAAESAEFSARKLSEAPPLSWAPAGRKTQSGLEWIFYGIIALGVLAVAIIGYIVFHRAASTATTPEPTETPSTLTNAAPATEPAATPPPASAAPPANASVPPANAAVPPSTSAVVPAVTPPPTPATPPATATPPAAVTPAVVPAPEAANTNTPTAAPAPVPPPSSPAQDTARQASAFVSDGILKYQQGDFENAIGAYNQALTINPKSTEAYFNRGIAKIAREDLDGAIADYSQALDIDPNMGQAYYYRGLARHSKGDLDGAMSDYNNSVRIDPKKSLAFFNRGLIRMQKDDIDGAIVDSTRTLELDPQEIRAYYNRGLGRMAKGATDGALTDMRMFIQLAPQDSRSEVVFYVDYARLYAWLIETQEGQLAEANKELRDAMNHGWNGKPTDMVTRIGEFLLGQISEGDLIKSSASTIPLKDQGQRCEVWYFIGMRKFAAGDKEGAIDALRKCVDTQKTDYCEYILAQEALKRIGGATEGATPIPPRAAPASLPDPGTMAPAPH